jgi:hypothetical protein
VTRFTVTVDPGNLKDLGPADHLLRTLAAELDLPADTFGCTHLIRDERPRVAVSLSAASDVLGAVREQLGDRGYEVTDGAPDGAGRAVLFPGADELTGTLTIAEILSRSAIDAVQVLGSPAPPPPETRLATQDHVRPQWQAGELVLKAMPAVGGVLVPFEFPSPTPCCADH